MKSIQSAAVDLLAKTWFFGSLGSEDLEAIAACTRPAAFTAGQPIFFRHDEARDLFVVRKGRVRLSILSSDGRELSLAHATENDVFGEIAVLDGGSRTANATALNEVDALLLSRGALLALMEARPRIALAAIAFLCDRLRTTDSKIESIALHPIEVRLARFLLSAVQLQSPDATGKTPLSLGMSQSELALLLGASRQKVNKALAALEEAEAFRRDGTQLLCDLTILRAYGAADLGAGPCEQREKAARRAR